MGLEQVLQVHRANKHKLWPTCDGQLYHSCVVICEQMTYGPDSAPASIRPPSCTGKGLGFPESAWQEVFLHVLYVPQVGVWGLGLFL